MPRTPDAELEGRILDAAYRLWSKGGSRAVTMRAVADAAETTTPTVYDRFRDKRDLLALLHKRALEKLVAAIEPAHGPLATCRAFLDFAVTHPNQYRLLAADWAAKLGRNEPKPTFDLIKKRLAAKLGGKPEHHARLALALGALIHGTATMLLAEDVHEKISRELRAACLEACEGLIAGAAHRRNRKSLPSPE
jgi:AcrR family transcriptional regulator